MAHDAARAARAAQAASDGPSSEHDEFLFGVDTILDGVQALIDQARSSR